MNKTQKNYFSLESILGKKGIILKDEEKGNRDVVDILEDMYLRLAPGELCEIFYEISEEEDMGHNIFQEARDEN